MRILLVGATSAIAMACARLWAAQGGEFVLVARNEEKLAQNAADLSSRGAKAVTTIQLDLNDFDQHQSMFAQCLVAMPQIDVALVAHGTLPDQQQCEHDVALALREFNSNGLSTIALLTLLAKHFERQRCGTIAVIGSVAGDRGRQSNYLYGSAKAAVGAFCEGMRARMFKVGVHVMTIKPGFVDTPMTRDMDLPEKLVVSPERVGRDIVRGVERKTNTLYTPFFWSLIMFIIRSIPQSIFKRLSL